MTNILMTSVNWRVEIVRIFRKYLKKLNKKNKIITTDIHSLSAGIYFSDKHYMVPLYVDKKYLPFLKKICLREKINFIIPQTDRDCNFFANHLKMIESWGVKILMLTPKKVKILNDKLLCKNFFKEHKILVPKNYAKDKIDNIKKYPIIVKPRNESGSTGIKTVRNQQELLIALASVKNPMIEKFIKGNEFTIDGATNLDHSLIGLVPRKRLAVKAGTIVKGVTIYDKNLIDICKQVVDLSELSGFFCLQFIKQKDKYYLIEVNTRVGSGIVLSAKAGFNIGKVLEAYANNKNLYFKDTFFKANLYMMQYLKPFYKTQKELL